MSWVGIGDGLWLALDRLAEEQGGREAGGFRVQFTGLPEKPPRTRPASSKCNVAVNPRKIPSGCAKNGHGGAWACDPSRRKNR